MKRRSFLASSAAMTLAAPAVRAAGNPKVLKFAPQADIALLDPHFAPALVTRNHAYLVYDFLYGLDDQVQPKPQMAAGHVVENDGKTWKITLRDGLKFHDGEPVLARDAVASLKRWSKRDVYALSVFQQVDEVVAASDKVIEFRLKRPFRLLADLLGKQNPFAPAIMPERLANADPTSAVKEIVGSGPYKFVMGERVPGSRAVYEKFAGYVPRGEGKPEGTAGPKIAMIDRIEWHTIPDPATAAAALQSGEIDWWEQPHADLLPLLRKNKDIVVDIVDTLGYVSVLRFNHLMPPFDNPAIRRALLGAFSQKDMMQAVAGDAPGMSSAGVGYFAPQSPLANDAGMERLTAARDLARVKKDLEAAGYNGQRFNLLVPTDLAAINAMSEVGGEVFRKLGMNMDYVTADWATVAARLNSQEPLEKGGWNLNFNYGPGFSQMSPAAHGFMRGLGKNSLFGWPSMPKVEALRSAWIEATDAAEQQRIGREIQLQCFEDVPYIPLGAFFFAAAYRKDLTGVIKGGIPVFYNVKRTA
ncbi:MAG: ABC transporter substrate-binding protein [Alphaproteobacteria bacterium]|nr:ABC transporter substrate-binding protein [Alphaproteobacteria bacterium]